MAEAALRVLDLGARDEARSKIPLEKSSLLYTITTTATTPYLAWFTQKESACMYMQPCSQYTPKLLMHLNIGCGALHIAERLRSRHIMINCRESKGGATKITVDAAVRPFTTWTVSRSTLTNLALGRCPPSQVMC